MQNVRTFLPFDARCAVRQVTPRAQMQEEEFDDDDDAGRQAAAARLSANMRKVVPTSQRVVREPYTDADGVFMEWDIEHQAYFPRVCVGTIVGLAR